MQHFGRTAASLSHCGTSLPHAQQLQQQQHRCRPAWQASFGPLGGLTQQSHAPMHPRATLLTCKPSRSMVVSRYQTDYASNSYHDDYDDDDYDDDDDDDDDDYDGNDSADDEEDSMAVHHVHSRLPVSRVVLGDGRTHVVVYENGNHTWYLRSNGLIDVLERTRKRRKCVDKIALGRNEGSSTYTSASDPDEVWFVARDTGTTYMGESCEQQLRDHWWDDEGDDFVEAVAFAPDNGWYVFKKGGGAQWDNLPDSLQEDLEENWDDRDGVQQLSVGHNGEWFVRYHNGAYTFCGVHPVLDKLLSRKELAGRAVGNIERVELGPDGTFVALFSNHTVRYGGEVLTEHLLDSLAT